MFWGIIALILLILILLFFIFLIYFQRSPARKIPEGKNIVSPASGEIVAITHTGKNKKIPISKGLLGKVNSFTSFLKGDGIMVSIMMRVTDVHVQRSPVSGIVESVVHNKGKFVNAVKEPDKMRWLENENIETIINNPKIGKVKVIQIAGVLARRCVSYLHRNQKIIKGQHIGLIRLGSQVSIIMPSKVVLKVKKGQKVIDGETIIAQY